MKILNKEQLIDFVKQGDFPRISGKEIEIIYVRDFWDGPLEGLCVWQNNKYYFFCTDLTPTIYADEDPSKTEPRRFILIKLTQEQLENTAYCQKLFSSLKIGDNLNIVSKSEKEFLINLNRLVGWFTLK